MKWNSLLILLVSFLCIVSCQTKEKSDLLFEKYYEPESDYVDVVLKKFDYQKPFELDSTMITEDSMYYYNRKAVRIADLEDLEKKRKEYFKESLLTFKNKDFKEAYKRFEYYCATYFDSNIDHTVALYFKAKSNLNDGTIDQSVVYDYEDFLQSKRLNQDMYNYGNFEMILTMIKLKNPNAKGLLEATFGVRNHIKAAEIQELYKELE